MNHKFLSKSLIRISYVLAVMMLLVGFVLTAAPQPVLAQDPAPAGEPAPVEEAPPAPAEESPPLPADQAPPGEAPLPLEEAAAPLDSAAQPAAPETVAEVVEALAETENVALVDASGEELSLASQDTADLLSSTTDPYFTYDSVTYGYSVSGLCPPSVDVCSASPNPIQAAIDKSKELKAAKGAGFEDDPITITIEKANYTGEVNIDNTSFLTLMGAQGGNNRPTIEDGIWLSGINVNLTLQDLIIKSNPGNVHEGVVPTTLKFGEDINAVINNTGVVYNFTMKDVKLDGEGIEGRADIANGWWMGNIVLDNVDTERFDHGVSINNSDDKYKTDETYNGLPVWEYYINADELPTPYYHLDGGNNKVADIRIWRVTNNHPTNRSMVYWWDIEDDGDNKIFDVESINHWNDYNADVDVNNKPGEFGHAGFVPAYGIAYLYTPLADTLQTACIEIGGGKKNIQFTDPTVMVVADECDGENCGSATVSYYIPEGTLYKLSTSAVSNPVGFNTTANRYVAGTNALENYVFKGEKVDMTPDSKNPRCVTKYTDHGYEWGGTSGQFTVEGPCLPEDESGNGKFDLSGLPVDENGFHSLDTEYSATLYTVAFSHDYGYLKKVETRVPDLNSQGIQKRDNQGNLKWKTVTTWEKVTKNISIKGGEVAAEDSDTGTWDEETCPVDMACKPGYEYLPQAGKCVTECGVNEVRTFPQDEEVKDDFNNEDSRIIVVDQPQVGVCGCQEGTLRGSDGICMPPPPPPPPPDDGGDTPFTPGGETLLASAPVIPVTGQGGPLSQPPTVIEGNPVPKPAVGSVEVLIPVTGVDLSGSARAKGLPFMALSVVFFGIGLSLNGVTLKKKSKEQ